jgi:hypothetical protein
MFGVIRIRYSNYNINNPVTGWGELGMLGAFPGSLIFVTNPS